MPKYSGYTLLELLLTLLLSAILFSLASISWLTLIINNTITTKINHIFAALQLTRSEAITRGEQVTFCSSNNHLTCNGEWNDGQIIINHANKVVQSFPSIPKNYILIWKSSFGKNNAITFTPIGDTNGTQGSFCLYVKKSLNNVSCIIVEHTGRMRIQMKTFGLYFDFPSNFAYHLYFTII